MNVISWRLSHYEDYTRLDNMSLRAKIQIILEIDMRGLDAFVAL